MFENILEKTNKVDVDKYRKRQFFEERTQYHIKLVQEAAARIVLEYPEYSELLDATAVHDASKYEEPELGPYIELTWLKKQGEKATGALADEITTSTIHHLKNNQHHPEYWLEDATKANVDSTNRDDDIKCIDATRMPELAIAEMVSDWEGMSNELKTNTSREWYDSIKDVRYHFSGSQDTLIDKLLKVFEK